MFTASMTAPSYTGITRIRHQVYGTIYRNKFMLSSCRCLRYYVLENKNSNVNSAITMLINILSSLTYNVGFFYYANTNNN